MIAREIAAEEDSHVKLELQSYKAAQQDRLVVSAGSTFRDFAQPFARIGSIDLQQLKACFVAFQRETLRGTWASDARTRGETSRNWA